MKAWRWLISGFFIFYATALYANEGAPETGNTIDRLDDIVVTATKTEKRVADAPAAVTVVTREDMDRRNFKTADDALNSLEGVFVKRSKGLMDATSGVRMRGFNGDHGTLVLLDGQPLNDAYTGGVEWGALPTDNIERIEVIRGPASALYGGNAMGGVINIITRTPQEKELKASAGIGTHNMRRYRFSAGDRLGDTLGLRIGYEAESTNGYENTPVLVSTEPSAGGYEMNNSAGEPRWVVGDKGENGAARHSLNAKVDYEFADTGKLAFNVVTAQHNYDYGPPNTYTGTFTGTGYTPNSFISYTGNGENYSEMYALSGEQTFGKIKADFQIGTTRGVDRYTLESGSNDADYNNSSGELTVTEQEKWFSELRGAAALGDFHMLTLGVCFRTDESDTNQYDVPFYRSFEGRGASTFNARGKDRFWGFFAQEEWQALDVLTLYLGMRYDTWEVYDGRSIDNGARTDYSDNSDSYFSPKLAAVWKATATTTLKASMGQAFRPPTIYELFRSWKSASTDYNANSELEPEKVQSYEIGIDKTLFDRRTALSLNFYQNDTEDMIYYDTSVDDLSGRTIKDRINAGKARTLGIEATISQIVAHWLTVWGNYTFTDARILESPTDPESEDKQVTGIPEQTWNLGLDTTFGPVTAGVIYRYFSKIYNESDNEDTEEGVYSTYEPSHIIDAKATWQMVKWAKLSLSVDNIFDNEYYQYYKTDGRIYLAELSLNY